MVVVRLLSLRVIQLNRRSAVSKTNSEPPAASPHAEPENVAGLEHLGDCVKFLPTQNNINVPSYVAFQRDWCNGEYFFFV